MKMKNQEQKTKIILEKYYGKNRRREGKKRAVFHDGPAKSHLIQKGKKPFINDGYLGLTEKEDSPSNDQSPKLEESKGGFIVEEEEYQSSNDES